MINKDEVLRYLGYKGQNIDEELDNLIDISIEEVKSKVKPRFVYELYDLKRANGDLIIEGTNLILKGNDIAKCLENCDKVILMAVTLGNEMEKMIRLVQRNNLTKAVILDSIATAYVEDVCDNIEKDIYDEYKSINKSLSFRYSPGYGDLSLKIQRQFVETLNAGRRIGLNVSDSNLLIPRKSVTAILGIKNEVGLKKKRTCETCANFKNCKFRREGVKCGD
ncbi:MAG: methionine synthase [Sarcina sp.]